MMVRALWKRRLLWPGEIDGAEASLRRWAIANGGGEVGAHGGGILHRHGNGGARA